MDVWFGRSYSRMVMMMYSGFEPNYASWGSVLVPWPSCRELPAGYEFRASVLIEMKPPERSIKGGHDLEFSTFQLLIYTITFLHIY